MKRRSLPAHSHVIYVRIIRIQRGCVRVRLKFSANRIYLNVCVYFAAQSVSHSLPLMCLWCVCVCTQSAAHACLYMYVRVCVAFDCIGACLLDTRTAFTTFSPFYILYTVYSIASTLVSFSLFAEQYIYSDLRRRSVKRVCISNFISHHTIVYIHQTSRDQQRTTLLL